jgi:sulfur carrier protein ThiS
VHAPVDLIKASTMTTVRDILLKEQIERKYLAVIVNDAIIGVITPE